jgi:hypothetical protein
MTTQRRGSARGRKNSSKDIAVTYKQTPLAGMYFFKDPARGLIEVGVLGSRPALLP